MRANTLKKIKDIPLIMAVVVAVLGLKNAIQIGAIRIVISTWLTKHPRVIFYCAFSSHLQNVSGVIQEMSACGYKVIVVLGFKPGKEALNKISYATIINTMSLNLLAIMRARLFITPLVGYPRIYTPFGSSVVHFLVSITSLDGVYAENHFDDYDYIFCVGKHHLSDFRKLAKRRNLTGKIIIPGGYPKLDSQIRWLEGCRSSQPSKNNPEKVVIYAPTHVYSVNENLASLRRYGEHIVKELLATGFTVIFRPHPDSFRDDDKETISKISENHKYNPRFSLDKSKNYMESYARADLMVTDLSGTGFTFAFTFQRPAVFFAANADAEVRLEGIQFHSRHEIGDVVRSLSELGDKCLSLLAHRDEIEAKIALFRDKTVFNLGTSAKYFCHCLPYIERGEMDKDWVVL